MAQTVEDSLVVRMEASLRKFERQMEAGRRAAVRSATDSERVWSKAGTQITANANRATTGIARLGKVSGAQRFVLQNTANQVGDIAVQLESGTNAFRVMGQQVPQILGGFGALGGALGIMAPLLGTVAALGFPMAAMFLRTGEESEKASKKVKTFSDKLSEAQAAIASAENAMMLASEGGLDDLQEKYGIVTQKVRELAEALSEIEVRAAKVKIGQLLDDALGDSFETQMNRVFGAVGGAIASAGSKEAAEEIEFIRDQIKVLEAEIAQFTATNQQVPAALTGQLTEMNEALAALEGRVQDIGSLAGEIVVDTDTLARLSEFRDILEEARAAGDFVGMADALSSIRQILQETGVEIEQGVIDGLTQAEDVAREMAVALGLGTTEAEDLAKAAAGIAGAISPAVTEAMRLVTALESGARLARIISGLSSVGGNLFDRVRGLGRTIADAAQNPIAPRTSLRPRLPSMNFNPDAPEKPKAGGSAGTPKPDFFADADKQIETLKRQIEMVGKTSAEIAELTAKYKLLDEAKARGLDLDAKQAATGETLRQEINRQAEAIGNLTDQEERAAERAAYLNDLQSDLKDGFIDAAIEGENLAGVLENVAKSLAKAALQAALFGDGPMAGLFGGGGGGGLFGALGIKLPTAASGTAFSHGGTTLVGERGPELVNLPRGAKVYSNARSRGMGGTNVEFRVVNNATQATVSQRQERGPDGRQILVAEVNDAAARGELTGVQARFGLKGQKVRR